jgi:hypothetical protein
MGFSSFRCGRCGSLLGYQSRPRGFLEKHLLRLLLLRTVRCGDCFHRSYRMYFVQVREPKQDPKNSEMEHHAAA